MLEVVFLLPLIAGGVVFFLPRRAGRVTLVGAAAGQLLLVGWLLVQHHPLSFTSFFVFTPEGGMVLGITAFLFLFVAIYTTAYMAEVEMHREPLFHGCLLLFLGTMSMVAVADHLIVFWIAVEATTLVSAPLIILHRSTGALEATWKYVLICSVGIALALLGAFLVALAMERAKLDLPLAFSNLAAVAPGLDKPWLKAGFVFILIGYGTKMGLAPMHTWLPDAHSEAASPASALLSGALLNCAFLGIFKTHALMTAAGLGGYSGTVLMVFGLISMLVAAVFIMGQKNYKRLLAYSSIENMGVIAFGTGVGGLAGYGALLHLLHHSLLKSSLFLTSGNLLLGYGSKLVAKTGNMPRLLPKTFVAFAAGLTGISGFPPFGLFVSELLILFGAFRQGRFLAAGLFIVALILVFAGVARALVRMGFGNWQGELLVPETLPRLLPVYALLGSSLLLCLWMPPRLEQLLNGAALLFRGGLHG